MLFVKPKYVGTISEQRSGDKEEIGGNDRSKGSGGGDVRMEVDDEDDKSLLWQGQQNQRRQVGCLTLCRAQK